jgi:proline iminopeptidase
MVAIVYAATHPERVDHLILSNTIARQPTDELTRWEHQVLDAKRGEPWYDDARAAWAALDAGEFADAAELAELLLREQPLHFARYGSAERAYLETLASEMQDRAVVLLRRGIGMSFDLRPRLARIEAKTLVITGDQDTNGPPAAKEIARAIPGTGLVVIPHCGHFAFVEDPERFRSEVLSFLVSS